MALTTERWAVQMAAFYNANFKHPRDGGRWEPVDFGAKPPANALSRYTQSEDDMKAKLYQAFGVGVRNGS